MSIQEAIKVEKGIPFPAATGGRKSMYPWENMDVGDSFLFPEGTKKATASSLTYRQQYHWTNGKKGTPNGKRFAVRSVEEGLRCWRLE